jgi:hypothetical protein
MNACMRVEVEVVLDSPIEQYSQVPTAINCYFENDFETRIRHGPVRTDTVKIAIVKFLQICAEHA